MMAAIQAEERRRSEQDLPPLSPSQLVAFVNSLRTRKAASESAVRA
jgi:hypothetical protein